MTEPVMPESEFVTWTTTEKPHGDWTTYGYFLAGARGAVEFMVYRRPLPREDGEFLLSLWPNIVDGVGLMASRHHEALRARPQLMDKLPWLYYLDGQVVECLGERVGWHSPRPWYTGADDDTEGLQCAALRGAWAGKRCYFQGRPDAGMWVFEALLAGLPTFWQALQHEYQHAFCQEPSSHRRCP
jgi:hypothetical protein